MAPSEQALPSVVLKSGRDRSVRARHPRLFSGAIKLTEGKPRDGNVVDVRANTGEWLARGIINQQAQIAVRLLTWDNNEIIDDQFWVRCVARAVTSRERDPLLSHTNARRLIFGESDGLPGVIADDYAGHIVLQLSTLAAANARTPIVDALTHHAAALSVTERNDDERMRHEHLKDHSGAVFGTAPSGLLQIQENDQRYLVDIAAGQKTGFYLDQRENRARLAPYCHGAAVLNVFSYTGAFGIVAAAHGAARVVNIDSSADALHTAEANVRLLKDSPCTFEYVLADAFEEIRRRRSAGEKFDIVILDPPKFAHSPDQIDRAVRAYKDLNRLGLGLVNPGGLLATFSCSGVIDPALFQKAVFSAAVEADRDVQAIARLSQASDHPILLSFPESEYLKGLLCRVL